MRVRAFAPWTVVALRDVLLVKSRFEFGFAGRASKHRDLVGFVEDVKVLNDMGRESAAVDSRALWNAARILGLVVADRA